MGRTIILIDIGQSLALGGVLPSAALHGSYAAQLVARNGTPPYVYTISTGVLPAGITLDRLTGHFSSTDVGETGSFPITVRATDVTGAFVERRYTLQVISEPVSLSGDAPAGTVGEAYSYGYTAAGGTSPYTFSISAGALPAGVTLNAATGVIAGTPTAGGSPSWTVRVTDHVGGVVDLPDSAAIGYATLTLSGTYPAATVGTAYSADITIAGGDGTYTKHGGTGLASGTLPPGLALSIVSNKLRLSGTPTGSGGTYAFTVSVDSGDGQNKTSAQNVVVSAAAGSTTWDPSAKASTITLSSGNLIATKTSGSTYGSVRATNGKSSGKRMFRVKNLSGGVPPSELLFGIATATASLTDFVGSSAAGWAKDSTDGAIYHSNVAAQSGAAVPVSDIVDIYVDLSAHTVRFGIDGSTPGAALTIASGTWFPAGTVTTTAAPDQLQLDVLTNTSWGIANGYSLWDA